LILPVERLGALDEWLENKTSKGSEGLGNLHSAKF
jgi:hypothetical protein